ncbi:MAG: response regulator, partial [Pirellulaceae bacterium]
MNTPSDPPAVIVIAEDSRIQGMVLKNRLEQAGYIAHIGADGELALDLVRRHLPKLVISDIEMPKMNGYGLCRAIKTDPSLRHIPVILLSTLSDAEDIIQGLDVGADNYVTKPYDPAYLLSRVESMLTQPVQDDQQPAGPELKVTLHGKTYTVRSGRQQTLNLLVSTFENAVEKNRELHRSNEQLTLAKEKLTQWNAQLESLNTKLASLNQRMTHDLHAAARVQKSLLPNESQPIPGIEIAWRYIPCEELAGDFLNYARLDEHHVALY